MEARLADQSQSVGPQSGILALNCLVDGGDSRNIFLMKILNAEPVSALQKAIKDDVPAFQQVLASDILLYRVSIPVDKSLRVNLQKLDFADQIPLEPVDGLLEIFPDAPHKKHLHIFIRSPEKREYKMFRS
jgi:Crinkler effector protein N-terminal domain